MNNPLSRAGALREACMACLARPLAWCAWSLATACLLAAMLVVAGLQLRLQAQLPLGARAQALVLVGGAQGETDLGAVGADLHRVVPDATVEFRSRDVALAELAHRRGLAGSGVADLRPNPLPDAFVVRFAAGLAPAQVEAAVAQLAKVHLVDTVEYLPAPYRRVAAVAAMARALVPVALALGAAGVVLVLVAAIGLWSRVDGDRVRLLLLLGAAPSAIRRPYVYAAALQAAVTGALAGGLFLEAVLQVGPAAADLAAQFGMTLDLTGAPNWLPLPLAACGALGATLGASLVLRLSMRRLSR